MGSRSGILIIATGSAAPAKLVTNDDVGPWGDDAEWIVRRTGFRACRYSPDLSAAAIVRR